MKTIALKLPDELLTKIEQAANKRGKTKSAVMRVLSASVHGAKKI